MKAYCISRHICLHFTLLISGLLCGSLYISQLEEASTLNDMKSMLDSEEFSFRFDIGVSDLTHNLVLGDRDRIVRSIANYFTVVRVKVQIDQLTDGLKALGVLDIMKGNPHSMRELFLSKPKPITADGMINLFETRFSPVGSNRCEDEEAVALQWIHLIQLIEGKKYRYYI